MQGVAKLQRIDTKNSFYGVYDKESDSMFFVLPGKWGWSHIYRYHPIDGWKKLTSVWYSEVQSMIVSEDILYYTVEHELGPNADLFLFNSKTNKKERILRNEIVTDICAADCKTILVNLDGGASGQHSGLWLYSVVDKQLMAPLFSEYTTYATARTNETGISLKQSNSSWDYFDFETETIIEMNLYSHNYVDIYNVAYWTEMVPGSYNISIYLNGNMIHQVTGYEGITKNEDYVIWYTRTSDAQSMYVLDVAASVESPHIMQYEIVTTSNIYILGHHAAMLTGKNDGTIMLVDLETGAISHISP